MHLKRRAVGLCLGVGLVGLLQGCFSLEDDVIPKLGSVTVTPTSGLGVTEADGTATFTVVLGRQPGADVTIAVDTSDPGEGTPDTALLTFTPGNWNAPQTVTVTGVDDSLDDGDAAFTIRLAATSSADHHYAGIDVADVAVTNADNDDSTVDVSPTAGLVTTENGGQASFDVVLTAQPGADVTITIASSNTNAGTVSTPLLTFTPGDWNVAQTVTITGLNDAPPAVGNTPYTILTGAAASADPNYNGVAVADVSVTNNDNDAAGVTVNPTAGLTTTEPGGTASFSVVLNTQPTGDVVIDVSTSNANEGLVSTGAGTPANAIQLTFTTATWDTAQTVTVTGVNDAAPTVDGNQAYTIVVDLNAAGTQDAAYDPLVVTDVDVLNLDDDQAGFTITPLAVTTTEGGAGMTFTVALDTVPSAPVTITVASLDTTEGTVATATLTFQANPTALDPQTVTVTPAEDALLDGDIVYLVELGADATTADANYLGRNPADVVVTNQDNDVPGITVTPTAVSTNEAGTTANFTVVLDSIPASGVTITLTGLDATEGTLSTTTLLFNPNASALVPQTVTVTGVDDIDIEIGNTVYTLTGTPTGDAVYAALAPFTVSVTNVDDESAPPGSSPGPGTQVLDVGAGGAFDDKRVIEPFVLLEGATYKMWYEGSNATGQKHEQVGLATAPAVGGAWARNPASPVMTHSGVNGTIDKTGVGDPSLLGTGGLNYTMWFGCRENAAHKTRIARATSTDGGLTWTKYALSPGGPTATILEGTVNAFDATATSSPHVILDGAVYKMWYQGLDPSGIYRIGYATSPDGIAWTKTAGPVIDVGAAGAFDDRGASMPCVIKDGAIYRMWYIGRDDVGPNGVQRLGYAQSTDGITWVKYPGNPILDVGAPGAFDETRLWSPYVLKEGATYHIWYAGEDSGGEIRLGYTTSP